MAAGDLHSTPEPTEALLAGRRALDGIREVAILEDWTWYKALGCWALRCRLKPDVKPGGSVPRESDWYVVVDSDYPWGSIVFYPAQDGGITQTFPHQNYNGDQQEGLPWRSGRLCVDTHMHVLGRRGYDIEPFGAHDRLKWHFSRALEWLREASFERLALPGEPFELPDFRSKPNTTIAFSESTETLSSWETIPNQVGTADLLIVNGASDAAVVARFRSIGGKVLLAPSWGTMLSTMASEALTAAWVRLQGVPVLYPWQSPMTWGELREACSRKGVDIDERVRALAPKLRDGIDHVILLGMPVPALIGGEPQQMHWLAMKLPALTTGVPRGFRPTEKGLWQRDRSVVLSDSVKLKWYDTENWSAPELSGRGAFSGLVTQKTIAIIGAGALGSAISEQLVRAGAIRLLIVDAEFLEAGNLVRHTLTIDAVGHNKAEALANRLNSTSPHARVEAIKSVFPPTEEDGVAKLNNADVIIDCTGNDEVLSRLGHFGWSAEKVFASISLGMWARRLYLYAASGVRFPHEKFVSTIEPWLEKEIDEYSEMKLPREGIGCWHPLFPARVDDVWLMAAAAVKWLEDMLAEPPDEPTLVVMEQVTEHGQFTGIRRATLEE